jgi:hypothetical protein
VPDAWTYASPEAILDALVTAGEIDDAERGRIAEQLGPAVTEPVVLSLGATRETLVAELSSSAEAPSAPSASELFERVPEDAWVAVALDDAGVTLQEVVGAAGPALAEDLAGVEDAIGLDLAELATRTGDAAGYFGGTSVLQIGGAVMLEGGDADSLAGVLDGLERRLSRDPAVRIEPLEGEGEGFMLIPADVPIQFPFALRDGFLVAGLGPEAVDQALGSDSPLATSEPYEDAADALGDGFDPVAYLDFERMLELVGGLPGFWDDTDLAAARPYLERLDHFVAGSRTDDGRSLLRLALGVRDAGDGE